jgi:hypothetical protein
MRAVSARARAARGGGGGNTTPRADIFKGASCTIAAGRRGQESAVHGTTRGFYYAKSLLEDLGTPGVPRLPVPDVY